MDGCMNDRAKVEIRWFGIHLMKLGVKPNACGSLRNQKSFSQSVQVRPLAVFSLRIDDFRQKKLLCSINLTIKREVT
jgi:hypothetical protein